MLIILATVPGSISAIGYERGAKLRGSFIGSFRMYPKSTVGISGNLVG